MSASRSLIIVVLALFVPFTLWCVATGGGWAEVSSAFLANPWTVQVSIDLVLALSMVCVWMFNDARRRGKSALPWIVATLFTGSIAPLAYLVFRSDEPA